MRTAPENLRPGLKPGANVKRDRNIGEKIFGTLLIGGFYVFYFGDFLADTHGRLRIALLCVYLVILSIIFWADFDWTR